MGHRAVVLGASGYSGGELLRLLAAHPSIEVTVVSGGASAGRALSDVHPHLVGASTATLVPLADGIAAAADICFSCLPHGELAPRATDVASEFIVDLADDHRGTPGWVYGLPELDRDSLASATRIANPGCYPTATLLALVPFARANAIAGPVVVDALSGYSGAGRGLADHLSLASASGGAGAYGTVTHRHIPEMERGLGAFGGLDATVSFTPHLVPMSRGVLVTARATLTGALTDDAAREILDEAYDGEPFVTVTEEWPQTKPLLGTNRALVSARVDARSGMLIAAAAIDNLGKGAAGQAVQNANLALGEDESTGLESIGVWP